jgi:hypothetical protein
MTMIFSVVFLLLFSQTPTQKPPTQADPDDPGPPVVKRGGNAPRKGTVPANKGPNIITPLPTEETEAAPGPASSTAPSRPRNEDGPRPIIDVSGSLPPSVEPRVLDPLIEQAMSASAEYDATLPNFICDEVVTRSLSDAKPPKFKKKDLVEVELMYVDQKEDYRNVRINGKPLKTGTPEDTGSWSSGDWGTTLIDILHPATNANFKRRGKDKIAGLDCEVFDFTVEKPNSHWTIRYGKPIKPAYKGAIWIDPKSGRVLRTEMQAVKLPSDYELDWVEQMTEYGWVTINNEKYLLPTKSENLACWRYTTKCSRNELEFKNYRKFATESTISTTESEISFGDKAEEAKPAPAPPPTDKKKKKN